MQRRSLLKVGVALSMAPLCSPRVTRACDGRDDLAAPACDRLLARIGRNHGHIFPIGMDDLRAGVEKTYDLSGTSGHRHTITVTAADFARVRAGELVRLASSREGGHIHRLLLACAPAVDTPDRVSACDIEVGGKDEHELVIPESHVKGRRDRTYDIQGIASHPHMLTVTVADFEEMLRGKLVTIQSSTTDGHTHFVYIRYPRKS